MGRKKKYNTEEEKIQANRKTWMQYYERNKEERRKRALERYWKKKLEIGDEIWKRRCPGCDEEILYSIKRNRNNAEKNKRLCRVCINSGEKNPRYNKSNYDIWLEKYGETEANKRSNEINKKMSIGNRGKKRSEETRKNMSEAKMGENNPMYGKIFTEEHRDNISKSLSGRKVSDEERKKKRISAIQRIENTAGQLIPNYNPKSISIIEAKANELGIEDLQHAENGGEFHIKKLGYWVDGYSKEKNIVIEYYEPFHKNQVERDKRRKQEIIDYLGCDFIEITVVERKVS